MQNARFREAFQADLCKLHRAALRCNLSEQQTIAHGEFWSLFLGERVLVAAGKARKGTCERADGHA